MDINILRKINKNIVHDDGSVDSFERQLLDLAGGRYDTVNPMIISGDTRCLGYINSIDTEKPLVISSASVIKIREKHDIGYAFVSDCEKMLSESVLAFDSMRHESSKIVILDEVDEETGDPMIAICRADKNHAGIYLNEITSIYDKQNFQRFIERTWENDKTFYINKKTEQFFKSSGLQLPDVLKNALINDTTQAISKSQVEQEEKEMSEREKSVDMEKIYLRMPKSFVRKDVQSQKEGQEGKTYNKVTLPKNAKIAGNDIGGFSFYPLYVNDDKYSENLYNIPLLADQQVQLNKNGEKIMASPAEIKAAVEDSYKEYQMGARHEKQAQEAKAYEFAWEGLSFREYCLQRISDSLDTLKGETVAKENMAAAVKDNATHIPDTYESTKFIGRHIQEAQQIHDNYAAEGRSLPNPLEKPEEFQVHMVNAGIDACLAESKYLKEQTNNITLDDKTVDLVKADVGIKPSKPMEKQMSKKISKDKGIDLE